MTSLISGIEPTLTTVLLCQGSVYDRYQREAEDITNIKCRSGTDIFTFSRVDTLNRPALSRVDIWSIPKRSNRLTIHILQYTVEQNNYNNNNALLVDNKLHKWHWNIHYRKLALLSQGLVYDRLPREAIKRDLESSYLICLSNYLVRRSRCAITENRVLPDKTNDDSPLSSKISTKTSSTV